MVSSTSHASNVSDFTTVSHDDFNVTTINITLQIEDDESESVTLRDYVVLLLSAFAIFIMLVVLVALIIRKRR